MRNVAAALFRLEHNRDEQDMLEVLGSLVEWLKASEQTALRRAFVVWIRRVLLPNRAPEMELSEFNDLHELHHMLAERIKQWPERWEEKGRLEGRQEGRLDEARDNLRSLVKLKFSDVPSWVETRIEQAEHDQLKTWMRDTLFAEHLSDIFK